MEAFHLACVFLSLSTGEIFGYEIQPVDAVLFIDGAPTYMRLTNSTSLENVYACILETSRNVDSVIMATQMRGLILDVGQVEENVNESILRLSETVGQSLWKSEEDAKMLKARLARFLTADFHDSKNYPEAYPSNTFQRSIGWSHGGGRPRTYSAGKELSSATSYHAKESLVLPANHNPFVNTAKINKTSSFIWTSISPTEGTTTKTYSGVTKHYPSPTTATTFKHIPVRSSRLSSSSKPSSSDEYVKTEKAKSGDGSDIASGISEKTENVSHALDSDRYSSGKAPAAGRAPSPESENVVWDPSAPRAFNQILTEEGDGSDRSGTTSSDAGGKQTVPGEGEIGARKKDPQKKSENRRSVAGD